jgi:hypothetical protein
MSWMVQISVHSNSNAKGLQVAPATAVFVVRIEYLKCKNQEKMKRGNGAAQI